MHRRNFLLLLLSLSLFGFAVAQTASPTPFKKTNQRPAAKTQFEPFDNADVKRMAESCVRLETESGVIELEMFPESAPETVRNFLNLVATKFYDTTLFSRVVPSFVIQGGNFSTRLLKPDEMYSRANRKIKDEPNLIKHERGILSMARSDEPNSATTHFFILVGDAKHLDGRFSAFGRVIKGMEVVDAINRMPVIDQKPEKPVRLTRATVVACPLKVEQ